jgi:hypothetical protein
VDASRNTIPHRRPQSGSTRHEHDDQVTPPPCSSFVLVLDRQHLSSLNSLAVVANDSRIFIIRHTAARPHPLAHAPLQRRPVRSIAFPPLRSGVCGAQIPIANPTPPAVSSIGGFRTPALARVRAALPVVEAGPASETLNIRDRARSRQPSPDDRHSLEADVRLSRQTKFVRQFT